MGKKTKTAVKHTKITKVAVAIQAKKRHVYRSLLGVLAVVLLLLCIPATRHFLLGLVIKKDASIIIFNVANGEVVSGATIIVNNKEFTTNSSGLATLSSLPVGSHKATISGLFYSNSTLTITVPLIGVVKQQTVSLQPKGEIVKVTVKNQLNSVPMKNIAIASENGGSATTNENGEATLLLPANTKTAEVTLSGSTVLTKKVSISSSRDALTNVVYALPSQKVFFKRVSSGAPSLVSSYLDGSSEEIHISNNTSTGTLPPRIYTSPNTTNAAYFTDSSVSDSLAAVSLQTKEVVQLAGVQDAITPIGWIGDSFYFEVSVGTLPWSPDRQVLKAYDTVTKNVTTIDTARSEGSSYIDYAAEYFGDYYALGDKLVYTKYWKASYYYGSRLADKRIVLQSIQPGGQTSETIQSWQAGYNSFIKSARYSPSGIYVYVQQDGVQNSFWTYDSKAIVANLTLQPIDFTTAKYPNFLLSPSGVFSVWQEPANNKNVLYIGDKAGQNKKQISVATDFNVVSWLTEDYIIISDPKGQLYVMGRDGLKTGDVPLKITGAQL